MHAKPNQQHTVSYSGRGSGTPPGAQKTDRPRPGENRSVGLSSVVECYQARWSRIREALGVLTHDEQSFRFARPIDVSDVIC